MYTKDISNQLLAFFIVMLCSQLSWADGGYVRPTNNYITDVRIESDAAYIMTAGDLDNLTSSSGHTCTVTKDSKEYSLKIARVGGGMASGGSGGADSIIALLQTAQKAHLPVDFWLYSPVGTPTGNVINVGTCSGLDANLPSVGFMVL